MSVTGFHTFGGFAPGNPWIAILRDVPLAFSDLAILDAQTRSNDRELPVASLQRIP